MKPWLDEVDRWVREIVHASTHGRAYDLLVGDPLPEEWGGQAAIASYLAGCLALHGKEKNDATQVERSREFMLLPDPVHAFAASPAWEAIVALRAAHMLSDTNEEQIRAAMTRTAQNGVRNYLVIRMGIRRFNHAITTANMCDVISRLWPEHPDSAELRQAAEDVWGDWWLIGDNIEIAANYEAFAEVDLLLWAERRGEKARMLDDPMTHFWMDRSLEHMLPVGIVPGYGDTCTMELWADWFALYSVMAAWCGGSRGSRAAWNAERMFSWATTRGWLGQNLSIIDEVPDDPYRAKQGWTQIPRTGWYLALGREYLRKACTEPTAPSPRPVVTHRTVFAQHVMSDLSWSLTPPAGGPRVADKVVLKTGVEAESPSLMLGCARQVWHDHLDAGAVIAFASDGTVHLDDTGYMQKYPVFHNLFWADAREKTWLHYGSEEYSRHRELHRPSDYRVSALTGREVAQLAVIDCEAPHCMPIYHRRETILTRGGVAIIADHVEPYAAGLIGSPVWHVQYVHESTDDWAEVSIGEFRGMNGQHCDNAAGRMRILTPTHGDPWTIIQQENNDPYASPGYREPVTRYFHYWKRSFVLRTALSKPRPLATDSPNRFYTVLVPLPQSHDKSGGNFVELLAKELDLGFVARVRDGIVSLNHTEGQLAGNWGSTDALHLWSDGKGVFAHRVKAVNLPGLRLDTGGQWADLDLFWDNEGITGVISAERATTVTVEVPGTRASFRVHGITEVGRRTDR